ncbi:MAG: FecR family protein [Psychroflexus sp.]
MEDNNRWTKWFNNEITDDAVKNDAGFETFAKIKKYSSQLQSPEFDEEAVFQKIENNTYSKATKSNAFALKIAAFILVLVGIASFAIFFSSTTISSGENRLVYELPDESEVQLSPNSTIEYNSLLWTFDRQLNLIGKAYFDVAHGENFTVQTTAVKVEVLGTRFEVDAFSEAVKVTCFEGKVRVTSASKKQELSAKESLQLENNNFIKTEKQNLYPNWISKTKKFEKADFSEILNLLENVYSIELETENLEIKKRFTGVLPLNNLDEALKILSETYGLKIEKRSENSYIFVEDAKFTNP